MVSNVNIANQISKVWRFKNKQTNKKKKILKAQNPKQMKKKIKPEQFQ